MTQPEDHPGRVFLVPAGRAPEPEYWRDLAKLDESLDFSDPGGAGVASLLELKAQIENWLEPDTLLIDTRSGVTKIGGIATTLLADAVVCLTPPFAESLEGTAAVIAGIRAAPRLAGQRPIRVFEARHEGGTLEFSPEVWFASSPDLHPFDREK